MISNKSHSIRLRMYTARIRKEQTKEYRNIVTYIRHDTQIKVYKKYQYKSPCVGIIDEDVHMSLTSCVISTTFLCFS